MNQNGTFMQKLFPILTNKEIDKKTEMMAGLTTFLTMAYIIAVNPSILSETGMPAGALVTSTCLGAAIGCFLMAILANMPFALASGMGLNAYFAYTVVIGMGVSWHIALTAVFVEGIIFIILSLFKVREAVVNAIPKNLKIAVSGGIGLFIAFIGLINCGLVVNNDSTLIEMGEFNVAIIITCIGFIVTAVLSKKNVKGSILIGIVISSLLAWGFALINPEAAAALKIYLPNGVFKFESPAPIINKLDFSYITNPETAFNFITILCTFLFVDFFDTVGTVVGVASKANMVDEDGKVLKITAVKPKDIPIITGLDIKKASMYNVLETGNKGDIPALTNMFKELDAYKLKPKKIDINRNCEITMYIKDLKVQLGKNNNLDKKLSDFNDLYKNASKYKGTLNMKWVSTDGSYTLKKEQETTKSKNTKTKNNKK